MRDPFDDDWKKALKVGDKVIVRNWHHGDRVTTVATATKTHFTLTDEGARKWRRDGYGYVGQKGYWNDTIHQWSAKDERKIATERRRAQMLAALTSMRRTEWEALDDATLERVVALLDTKEVRDGE